MTMPKRYVLDGPPGSGKSTVLFGVSDGMHADSFRHTMKHLGYACVHESVAEANERLASEKLSITENKERWLEYIIKIDRTKFHAADDTITFYDRCFHHWKVMSEFSGIRLPEWYEETNAQLRYDTPIFLIAPIKSIDMSTRKFHESRRFTWQQRLENLEHIRTMYHDLGYETVDVPVFHEGDIERNNEERIRFILSHING